jgi:Lipocalin-like domain
MAIGSELRLALIGTWLLESYVEIDHETGAQDHPLGVTPQGIIMYTPDGYMSAQLQKSSRRAFVGGDLYEGEPSEYTEAGRTYIAYAGRFFLDEQSKRFLMKWP